MDDARRPLSERAYRDLRRRIVLCEIEPGAALTERDLAHRTGYGLTPIRRALARLDHDGLVTTVPRAGYRVVELDAAGVAELVDAWTLIGPEIVRRGLDAVSGPERAELQRIVAGWSAPGADADAVLRFSEASARVFEILAAACGNRWLRAWADQLSAQMSRVWVTVLRRRSVDLGDLTRAWDDGIAGRTLEDLGDELPRLVVDSGHAVLGLLALVGTSEAAAGPPRAPTSGHT